MDSARLANANNLLSLKHASEKLGVSKEVLLNWNEYNILKPTITLTGEIGYTSEQIDNFLLIQQISTQKNAIVSPVSNMVKHDRDALIQPEVAFRGISFSSIIQPQDDIAHQTDKLAEQLRPEHNKKLPYFLKIASVSCLFFLSIFSLMIKSDIGRVSDPQLDSKLGMEKTSNISTYASPTQQQGRVLASNDNIKNANIADLNQDKSPLDQIFDNNSKDKSPHREIDNSANLPLPVISGSQSSKRRAGEFTAFESKPSCPTCTDSNKTNGNSIFDEKGNIKGDQPKQTNLIAANPLDVAGIKAESIQSTQSINPIILIAISALGILSLMYIMKNQLAFAPRSLQEHKKDDFQLQTQSSQLKIIEVNQKTDGTVVLVIQGREHKISKPELDSESDQFITKLMEKATGDIKEIDYNNLGDEKIRFNTPLSKLVTRLGFVGIKRDLFFPRTSKNKVLFRKYITENDLIAMSLTTEQILSYI